MMGSLALGFGLGWIGSMPIAGAVAIFVFQRGLAGRVRDGLRLAAGAGVAEALWCTAARFGAGQVITRWPTIGLVAEVLGGAILVGLGIYFLRLRSKLVVPPPPTDGNGTPGNFRLGFFLVAGNVAVPVNWLALITIAHSLGFEPFSGPPGTFALGVAMGITGWFTVLLLLLDRFRNRFARGTLSAIMRVMGAVLVVTGVTVVGRLVF